MKILLIEDETDLRQNIAEILEFEGYSVTQASNGAEGITKAKEEVPELILCDVMMNELDGYEVLALLKRYNEFRLTPFIFITALSEKQYLRKGMELGADDFLIKPFSREELLNAISIKAQKADLMQEIINERMGNLSKKIVRSLPHELLTPLNSVLNFSAIIRDDINRLNPKEISELAEMIHDSGNNLFEIVQKYLMYIDLDVIKTKRRNSKIANYAKLIDPILREIANCRKRSDDIKIIMRPAPVKFREDLLVFLFTELFDNALKFSKQGDRVILQSSVEDGQLCFNLLDKGQGFDHEKIFAFTQFERETTEQKGVGLGLYLCKRIVEQYSGQFMVKSQPGLGTIVRFTLPLQNLAELGNAPSDLSA